MAKVRSEILPPDLLAGGQLGISSTAIHMCVTAPDATPLACVDTPGLTEVGLASRGQPTDMRSAVREAVAPHLEGPETIICVVAGLSRPEADPGGWPRAMDPEGRRTSVF